MTRTSTELPRLEPESSASTSSAMAAKVNNFIRKDAFLGTLFIFLVGLSCHFAFSWIGFFPMDDGFPLAFSGRILQGEIPFRDFVSARPIGTPVFHLLEVYFGGAYSLWVSRGVVWLQWAAIGWAWTMLIAALYPRKYSIFEKLSLALLTFIFSANAIPHMVWTTLDAVFFSVIGTSFALHRRSKLFGYFLIGFATVCRQSFGLVLPLALFILGDYRSWRCWLAGILSWIAHVILFILVPEGLDQVMGSNPNLLETGFLMYFRPLHAFGIVLGVIIGLGLAALKEKRPFLSGYAILLFFIGELCLLFYGPSNDHRHLWRLQIFAFVTFGLSLAFLAYYMVRVGKGSLEIPVILLTLLISWSSSISGGWLTPAYGLGLMNTVLVIGFPNIYLKKGMVFLACLGVVVFSYNRYNFYWGDLGGRELTYHLGEVLPCGRGIYTNVRTYTALKELNEHMEKAKSKAKQCVICGDFPLAWLYRDLRNPIKIDWLCVQDSCAPPLSSSYKYVFESKEKIQNLGKNVLVIKGKYDLSRLAFFGKTPTPQLDIFNILCSDFDKVAESEYFEIYGVK